MDTKLMCLQNSRGEFLIDNVDERSIKYLNNNCLECGPLPLLNNLAR